MAFELQIELVMKLFTRSLMPACGSGLGEASIWPVCLALGGLLVNTACQDSTSESALASQSFPFEMLSRSKPVNRPQLEIARKTLVINFWATWCPPCREEMPSLQALSTELDPERFAVIGISVDEDLNLLKEFLLEYAIDFAVLQDSAGQALAAPLKIISYPETLIVSPQGEVLHRVSGTREWQIGLLESLLGQTDIRAHNSTSQTYQDQDRGSL